MDKKVVPLGRKKAKPLGPLAVSRISKRGFNPVGTVDGLGLQVAKGGSRSWILRVRVPGHRRPEIGLGGYPDVTLADAQSQAREMREDIRNGIDPIAKRREAKSALLAANAAAVTFEHCAKAYITAHEAGWRNPKHTQQWTNTLTTYAFPVMGQVLVQDVSLPLVLAVLEPIWQSKTETAVRLRGRIEVILDWATTKGYRTGLNPARWKGHLDNLLAKPGKIAKAEHYAALPVGEVGAFMQKLREQVGMGATALEFAILTAARSGEVRNAIWGEVDLDGAIWTVPAERMKAGKEHRVPLAGAPLAVLEALPRGKAGDLVFPAPKGAALSDMTLSAVLRRMGVDAVPHGFRSTFRDWCSERTNYPHEAAEMALAHTIAGKVEAAYRRGDLFDKRRQMMRDWAAFCAQPEVKRGAVIPLRGAKRV